MARWSVHHPVGVVMIALALVVVGLAALGRLKVDLLPQIIYPEVRVRVMDPGVPPELMEERVTRQLEEQLAITEDAIRVQSRTTEGRTSVDLSFPYGKDIDVALRDASIRLDRARRFLPVTIEPPIIYKRDPSQLPVMELAVSAPLMEPAALRTWVDDVFAKWFLNLPGVAAVEVGGGRIREIQVLPDPWRLVAHGLSLEAIAEALGSGNAEVPVGGLDMGRHEISGRTVGRFGDVASIASLPVGGLPLGQVAQVVDGHADERLRVRLNGHAGVKVSIQKQPQANTVAVVDQVRNRLAWMASQGLIPQGVHVEPVDDQSAFVRMAIRDAGFAALTGGILAIIVVYAFLGGVGRVLIIASAIPIAITVTFALMALGGMTLNIMTLGGLALGVGMLVDSAIVMLENIERHQRLHHRDAPLVATREVTSAIIASTTTNLAAVLPFLFIGGLVGLLFRELIFTISAAIVASMVVALTLVPALAGKIRGGGRGMEALSDYYGRWLTLALRHPWAVLLVFLAGLGIALPVLWLRPQVFLPHVDEGQIYVGVTADPGVTLEEMDRRVAPLEAFLRRQPEVESVFATIGGFVFGRSEYQIPHRASLWVQLVPASQRGMTSAQWVTRMEARIRQQGWTGIKVSLRVRGVRGIRLGLGDDDISLRVQGPDLKVLARIGEALAERLRGIPGLANVEHTYEEGGQTLGIRVDKLRAAALGLTPEAVGEMLHLALEGKVVTSLMEGGRGFDVRLRLPPSFRKADALSSLPVFLGDGRAVTLGEIAEVVLLPSPATILRDNQQRIVEVSATLQRGSLDEAMASIRKHLEGFPLPEGYSLYDGGAWRALQEERGTAGKLLALALFLVFVVMAVQYESLRRPWVILLSVPFAAIGVAAALYLLHMPLSMPVWLGLIMLAGIVVNNAIVLVEFIAMEEKRHPLEEAIVRAAKLRIRPILMTTLTTVFGMLPLALGIGEGGAMLRPLAVTIVSGLAFSTLVSLFLVPVAYKHLFAQKPRIFRGYGNLLKGL
ncbi:MAG: efflux RND transporter permease subunit [Gammaproteobacteria bacterium]|nr:MAG: efflux RND transporter permease subunit [Gammaproteobacteria bacterium]